MAWDRDCARSNVGKAALMTPSTGKRVTSFIARRELTTGRCLYSTYANPAPAAGAPNQTAGRNSGRLAHAAVPGDLGVSTTSKRTDPALSARSPIRAFW